MRTNLIAACVVLLLATAGRAQQTSGNNDNAGQSSGKPEVVSTFNGAMPTGVTVSHSGRIFVNFPRWGDPVAFTVAELKNGKPVAYPDATINRLNQDDEANSLVSVQSVVVDPIDRLWILDTGSLEFTATKPGGPKLIAVDLSTNKIVKKISFPMDVALKTSYLNDVRFDLTRGNQGMAYITDSASNGPNGIVVVDLASGKSWRKLNDHPSTKADPNFVPTVENKQLMQRPRKGISKKMAMGADGIAISNDGKTLYYCPLVSRHQYSVSTDALDDPSISDAEVAKTVKDLGEKPGASDGLESDAQGRLYETDYEHNAIHRRTPDGRTETIATDSRMIWPDTMSLATDGYLYFTANQLNRQRTYNEGTDKRKKPYYLFKIKVDAQPVLLKK